MAGPVCYLLAGPNGAGKSTLYRAAVAEQLLPADLPFINADVHEARHLGHVTDRAERSRAAQAWADRARQACLDARLSFVSETVFSHPSKLGLLQAAQAAGFLVVLLIVCVDDPRQLLGRVAQRVAEGGHNVPTERLLARYPRTLELLHAAVRLADLALLYDTSSAGEPDDIQPPRLVARVRRGETVWVGPSVPGWTRSLLHPPKSSGSPT